MATDEPTCGTELDEECAEVKKVRWWRRDAFRELGFCDSTADLLADSHVDLHDAARMVKEGQCPLDLAARILI